MTNQKQGNTHRSFRWGVVPQFSRALIVFPRTYTDRTPGQAREPRSVRYARRDRVRVAAGLAGSVLIHGAVFMFGGSASFSTDEALGSYADRLLESATPIQVINLRPPARQEAAEPAVAEVSVHARPVLSIDPPKPSVRAVPASRPAQILVRAESVGALPTVGLAALPGLGDASDSDSDEMGEGDGRYTFIAPRARSILRTWSAPRAVIGLEVMVRVRTDETGRATGPVELVSPTPDEETNQEIIYRAQNLEYWPALQNGEPVAAWAEVSYKFCYDGVTAASPPSPTFGLGDPCSPKEGQVAAVSGR